MSRVIKEFAASKRQLAIVSFSLAAGISYRASGYFLSESLELFFLMCLIVLLLACTILAKRSATLTRYWQIPFAFFVFAFTGLLDLVFTQVFVASVLHQASTATNPLASTVEGTVLAQLVSTTSIVVPLVLLVKWSGTGLRSIFINRTRIWKGMPLGVIAFALFYLSTVSGFLEGLFPSGNVSESRFVSLTPAILVLVLSNGFREELWFRGLFLNRYAKFLSPLVSNLLQSIIFVSFHLEVHYTQALFFFLGITSVLSMWLGYMMQKSGNILGPSVFHAGADIPIFLGFLANVSS